MPSAGGDVNGFVFPMTPPTDQSVAITNAAMSGASGQALLDILEEPLEEEPIPGDLVGRKGGRRSRTDPLEQERARAAHQELVNTLAAAARVKAGFSKDGVPILVDENVVHSTALAAQLRAEGYNARSAEEVGLANQGVKDPPILRLIRFIGGRVITGDHGQGRDGGFKERAIRIDRRGQYLGPVMRLLATQGVHPIAR